MPVIVTETAAHEISNIIAQQDLDPNEIYLRVGVKGGGCSGFSYILDLTETKKDSDEVWETVYAVSPAAVTAGGDSAPESGGDAGGSFTLRVICDPKSYLYLNGTSVDFKDEMMSRGFVFNNPNATNTCGCGSSFSA